MSKKKLVTAATLALGLVWGLSSAQPAAAATNNNNGTVTATDTDTYATIAQDYQVSIADLEKMNNRPVGGFDLLYAGDVVKVDPNSHVKVSPRILDNTTLQKIQQTALEAANAQAVAQAQAQLEQNSDSNSATPPAAPAPTTPAVNQATPPTNLQDYVLNRMQAATGVSAAAWNNIITRESNWNPYIYNSTGSGAYGLFQNIHSAGGTVDQQIDAAIDLYNHGGLSHWAATR